jgi:hypothetical protein
VNLFPEDVRVGKDKVGRAHFKQWMDETLRVQFTGTSHHIGNHIIEFEDPDRAVGVVYSKNEHETPTQDGGCEWVIMQMLYWDHYERIDGRWYFKRRLPVIFTPLTSTSRPAVTIKCDGQIAIITMAPSTACFRAGKSFGVSLPLRSFPRWRHLRLTSSF